MARAFLIGGRSRFSGPSCGRGAMLAFFKRAAFVQADVTATNISLAVGGASSLNEPALAVSPYSSKNFSGSFSTISG